jgi:hypothetical protein
MHSTTRKAAAMACCLLLAGVLAAPCRPAEQADAAAGRNDRPAPALRQLADPELKALYRECSAAALQGSLGAKGIALCSVGYEILLRRIFSGDFFALLAWSRSEAAAEPAATEEGVRPIKRR